MLGFVLIESDSERAPAFSGNFGTIARTGVCWTELLWNSLMELLQKRTREGYGATLQAQS